MSELPTPVRSPAPLPALEALHAEAQCVMPTGPRPPVVMERGEGSWLFDEAGRRYLDFVQGWAVNSLGHAPPEIQRALAEQSARLLMPSPAFHNRPQLALSTALCRASGLDRVFLCSSGAEANEGAIKLARKWGAVRMGGAHEIVTTAGGFHGRTLAAMAASGRPGWEKLFAPPLPGFRKVPFGDADAVAEALDERCAAVLVEPIQGEAGVVVPPPGYLAALRRITRERGVLLMLDEIQTGLGRTGRLFAWQWEDAGPDVMTLGKGLGGGVPLAALLSTVEACCFEPGDQGGTYSGNPLMAAVGAAVLEVVSDEVFLAAVRARAEALRRGLAAWAAGHPGASVCGQGLLLALCLPAPVGAEVVARARDAGLLVNAPREDRLRFMPSLRVSEGEIAEMLRILVPILDEAVAEAA